MKTTHIYGEFIQLANCALNNTIIDKKNPRAKAVYLFLAVHCIEGEVRGLRVSKIAKTLKMDTDAVSACTRLLVSKKMLVKVGKDKNGILIYRLPLQMGKVIPGVMFGANDLNKANIPVNFIKNPRVPMQTKLLGATILSVLKGRPKHHIDMSFLEKLTGYSRRSLTRALVYLTKFNFLGVVRRKYQPNLYFINQKLLGRPATKSYKSKICADQKIVHKNPTEKPSFKTFPSFKANKKVSQIDKSNDDVCIDGYREPWEKFIDRPDFDDKKWADSRKLSFSISV